MAWCDPMFPGNDKDKNGTVLWCSMIGIYENTSSFITNMKWGTDKISKDDKVELIAV